MRRFPAVLLAAVLAAGAVAPSSAQQGSAGVDGPFIDRGLGEEEQIRARHAWFFSTRRAGTASAQELAELRLAAVRATGEALARQRAGRDSRSGLTTNIWVPKGPSPSSFGGWAFGNVSGRVAALAMDSSGATLYVATASGGLWRSDNDGLSWTQVFDSAGTMTVGTVAVDPNDSDVIWAGTGENSAGCESYFGIGLLRSADGGASWEPRNGSGPTALGGLASFADILIDPRDSDRLVTGGRIRDCASGSPVLGGIYTSSDGGLTWASRLGPVAVYEIARDPLLLDVLWAATGDGIYKSVDNGATWTKQSASGLPSASTGRTELAIAPSDGNVVYALFSSPLGFWRTVDGGVSWTQMSSGSNACDGQCGYNMVLRVHRTDPSIVYRGTVHLFRSTNGGLSWSDLSNNWGSSQTVHQDTHVLLTHPSQPDTLWVGSDGGLWKSTNGGTSFQNRNGNLNITQFYAIGVRADDPNVICGGAQDNSSLVRTSGDVWSLQAVTGDGFVCQFDPQNPSYAYITSYPSGGYPNVWRSSNGPFGGFTDVTGSGSGIINGDRVNWVTPYLLDPVTPTTLYLGTHRVYRSDDRGSSWFQAGPSDLTGGSGSLLSLEINRNFPDVLFSGSESGRVHRTTNGGSDWTNITPGLPSRSINDLAGDPTDPDRAFAVVGGFNTDHLWEWTAATGWTARPGGLPNVPTNTVLMLSDTDLLVGNDTGVFRSTDGGLTFQPFMEGLPQGLVVTDLDYNPLQGIVTAGTYGRGAWQVEVGPVRPILLFDSIELPPVELDGDGDEHVEPGETWSVRVRVRNGGGEPALAARARLATAAAGVTLLDAGAIEFGDVAPGVTATALAPQRFVIDPSVPCGTVVTFDLVEVASDNAPGGHADEPSAFVFEVLDEALPGPLELAFDDDLDPAPQPVWSHQATSPGVAPCATFPYFDDWKTFSKDGAHGVSWHAGNGPASIYSKRAFSWLHHEGRDSTGGAGLLIPADATSAELVVEHWYSTAIGQDGGQVVIDEVENGQDAYVALTPAGGYPAGTLASGSCNGLQGLPAFHGTSGGWITSRFDLLAYKDRRVWLAFLFASDNLAPNGEGWYVDNVRVEVRRPGVSVCQVLPWPGAVPPTAAFDLVAPGLIEARWDASCNASTVPGQVYAIQAGDLDLLRDTGVYELAPLGGACDRISPATFAPGAGNEYYLVVPADGAHQGGAGTDSAGVRRPLGDGACGLQREAVCP